MKILLAVDGSEATKHMLAKLGARAELLGKDPEFTALTVVTPITSYAARFISHEAIENYYREEAEAILRPVRAFARQNAWRFEDRYLAGHAADQIAKVADDGDFDLIVMGTRGHSSLANVVLGSVTTRVLARSRRPVLLIP